MLSWILIFYCYAECRYAECRYAECRYAECHCTKTKHSSLIYSSIGDEEVKVDDNDTLGQCYKKF